MGGVWLTLFLPPCPTPPPAPTVPGWADVHLLLKARPALLSGWAGRNMFGRYQAVGQGRGARAGGQDIPLFERGFRWMGGWQSVPRRPPAPDLGGI